MTTHTAAAASVPQMAPRRASGPGRIAIHSRRDHSAILRHKSFTRERSDDLAPAAEVTAIVGTSIRISLRQYLRMLPFRSSRQAALYIEWSKKTVELLRAGSGGSGEFAEPNVGDVFEADFSVGLAPLKNLGELLHHGRVMRVG